MECLGLGSALYTGFRRQYDLGFGFGLSGRGRGAAGTEGLKVGGKNVRGAAGIEILGHTINITDATT